MPTLAGLPKLRSDLDRAFAEFRNRPTIESAYQLEQVIERYRLATWPEFGTDLAGKECTYCDEQATIYRHKDVYDDTAAGYYCTEHDPQAVQKQTAIYQQNLTANKGA